jgi:hypothetical protein
MFKMTASVSFAGFKPLKPNALMWNRSVDNFSDTAIVKLPNKAKIRGGANDYKTIQTGTQFTEGMPVEIYAGYNGDNDLQFKGFVRRVNFTIPVEIECEGYSYQLRKKLGINKSYKNTTIKAILTDLIQGTDIKLHSAIPNIPIDKATFQNASGIQILDWIKDKCLLSVTFFYDQLYVGGQQLAPSTTAKFRLGWNVVKDSDLKFNEKEFATVKITVLNRNATGTISSQSSTPNGTVSGVKKLKTLITDSKTQADIAARERAALNNRGYEGSIMAFLKPFVTPNMAVQIEDVQYKSRTGKYFVTGVEGSFSTSGGRQKIKIGNSLG